MPLTKKGREIRSAEEREYGKAKGDSVFYASENSGKLKGIVKDERRAKIKGKHHE